MSPIEALWFRQVLAEQPAEVLSPVLNLGSSTLEYRTIDCPYIDEYLFRPLAERGVELIHSDLKKCAGVDFVGDILEKDTRVELRALGVKSVMCNNLLEHVESIEDTCAALAEICPTGGHLYMSVPHAYPFHPDPIDNGYRPSIEALEKLLSPYGFSLISGEIVAFGCYWQSLKKRPKFFLRDIYLIFAGLSKREKWRVLGENYRFFLRPFEVACAVFVKKA